MRTDAILYNSNGKVLREIVCEKNMRFALKKLYEEHPESEYNILMISDISEVCIDDIYIMNYDDVCNDIESEEHERWSQSK